MGTCEGVATGRKMGTTSKNSGGDHDGVVWVLWGLMSLSHARHNKVTPQVETLKIMTIQETKHTANILKILIYNLERGLFLLKRGGGSPRKLLELLNVCAQLCNLGRLSAGGVGWLRRALVSSHCRSHENTPPLRIVQKGTDVVHQGRVTLEDVRDACQGRRDCGFPSTFQ